MMEKFRPVRHDKTGKVYFILNEVLNTTNSNDGQIMILYVNLYGDMFVREKSEFWYKFSSVDQSDVHHIDKRIYNEYFK